MKTMKKQKKVAIAVGLLLVVGALIGYGFVGVNMDSLSFGSNNSPGVANSADSNTGSSLDDILNQNNEELLNLVDTRKAVIFAIYGTDERSDETGRSDIIMVVMYDPVSKRMVMASLPRDLRVNVPGYGLDKINHAFAYGGRVLSDQTIEELLGIKLDFSVKIDFETFSKIIDDVGGVNVNAKKKFYGEKNVLMVDEGDQLLTGKQALFYVRFRSDSDGDYGRIARQQEVIISLMKALSTMSLKKKIALINDYYNQGVETDAKISKIEEYMNMSSGDGNLSFENYRLQTYSEIINGLWYELYSQEDLEFIKNLFNNPEGLNQETWK